MQDESLSPVAIVKLLIEKYGAECADWEPEVIQKSMASDFQAAKINIYKGLAGLAIIQQDRFWNDWHTFHFLSQALNNIVPSAGLVQEMSIGQMMVAVTFAKQIREELGGLSYVPVFSEEVAKFVAAQALNQGVWYLPDPLGFASKYASKTVIHCNDCKNEEYFDEEEEPICPTCTAKYDTTSLSSFSPNKERLDKGFGTNVKVITKHSTLNVQKYLNKFLLGKSTNIDDNDQDQVCAVKLAIGIYYLNSKKGAE